MRRDHMIRGIDRRFGLKGGPDRHVRTTIHSTTRSAMERGMLRSQWCRLSPQIIGSMPRAVSEVGGGVLSRLVSQPAQARDGAALCTPSTDGTGVKWM